MDPNKIISDNYYYNFNQQKSENLRIKEIKKGKITKDNNSTERQSEETNLKNENTNKCLRICYYISCCCILIG